MATTSVISAPVFSFMKDVLKLTMISMKKQKSMKKLAAMIELDSKSSGSKATSNGI